MKVQISWINEYLFCPHAFYLHHVLGFSKGESEALVKGAKRHAELERKYIEEEFEKTKVEDALILAPIENRSFKYREVRVNAMYGPIELIGKIDELRIEPDTIYIFEDKSVDRVYRGAKYQALGYALTFKLSYAPDLPIKVAVRNINSLRVMWTQVIGEEDLKKVGEIIREIYDVINGNLIPRATPSPNRCRRCDYSSRCLEKL